MNRLHWLRGARLQSALLTALALTLLALAYWLSQQAAVEMDWTYGHRSSLSAESLAVLAELDGAVSVTAFVRDGDDAATLRRRIGLRFAQYRKAKPDLTLEFVNPDLEPDLARELGIARQGEMVLRLGQRTERLQTLHEQAVTNALYRLGRTGARRVWVSTDHGERDIAGAAGYDLARFSEHLMRRGFDLEPVRMDGTGSATTNGILVLASPSNEFTPAELSRVLAHLDGGGNLLWLVDPGTPQSLDALAEALGVTVLPGLIVDASAQARGIDNPTFVVGSESGPHVIGRALEGGRSSLFPRAVGIDAEPAEGWQATTLISTTQDSWTETGAVTGKIQYDTGSTERPGPITVAVALTRRAGTDGAEQRVIVAGDGDFLTNAYLGVGANLPLGLAMLSWLAADDASISIPTRPAPDTRIDLNDRQVAMLGLVFLIALPLALTTLGTGLWWLRRRRR
jgi:ABC-type uncharacterized transport system involved in gliding motility auxiliary subunit